jgi:hypothetical protein
MLRIRLVCVAAATLSIASVAAVSGAGAQSASTDPSSTPSLLTQLFGQATAASAPASTAPAPAVNTAPPVVKTTRSRSATSRRHKAAPYTKQAVHQHGDPSADTAQSNASADAWLAASAPQTNATPANSTPAFQPVTADATQMAAADPAQQDNAPSAALPSSVVVGGQTVQIAKADQVNEIDLAASSAPAKAPAGNVPANDTFATAAPSEANLGPTVQATMETTLPRGDRADIIGAAAVKAARADATQTAFSAAAPNSGETITDSAAQDSDTQNFSAEPSSATRVVAWIAEVLAALGGAVTAGIVGWFLIGAEPVRNYG